MGDRTFDYRNSTQRSQARDTGVTILVCTLLMLLAAVPVAATVSSPHPSKFTLFESGPVRPLAIDPTGHYLYAVNTPDNRLEIFRINPDMHPQGPLTQVGSVRVGLEPVAVAVRSPHEVWVVNHLSDSVSVVDVTSPQNSWVRQTLLVGDEPRDVVFAGPGRDRAFITTAHRGQNSPIDPQLTTPGVGRADVWVFDADDLGTSLEGDAETILTLFTDTPRALAVSADGSRVYAAGFHTGNQTTTVFSFSVTDGGPDAPDGMGLPGPATNVQGIPQPEEGLIVRFDGEHWRDEATGRMWDQFVRFNLPDRDVFTIDATANPPVEIEGESYASVGTVLFNMIANPVTGAVYVSNTEARNERRFEGPGIFGGTTVRGRLHQSRITILDENGVRPRHLNKHIDYDSCCAPLPNAENDRSLAQPVDMAITDDGSTLYVAAFGSAKVGVFSTAELDADSFVPDAADHIELSGGGPSGLVLDELRSRLYVLTRFDNTVSVIETVGRQEVARRPLFNPEPSKIQAGRLFHYDARSTSSNGEASCASCHVFGDLDSLAWDLGNPDGERIPNPGPFIDPQQLFPGISDFKSMKGPMTTQSLRGMANHGPMHWRGDRNGNVEAGFSAQPDTGLFDERQAFREFNPAFEGLVGGPGQLPAADMEAFGDFALEITYPPNPIRSLDNSLTPGQQRGRDHFFQPDVAELNPFIPGQLTSCSGCHVLDPTGNAEFGVDKPGFFGANGLGIVDTGGLQHVKAPHLRNAYQKVGMFGFPDFPALTPHFDFSHRGDQIRGFGFTHDGAADTIFTFISSIPFSNIVATGGFPFAPSGDPLRRDVEAFLLAFDSNMAPVVGQQVTLDSGSGADAHARADLLLARAAASPAECEVVTTTFFAGGEKSYLYLADQNSFVPNRNGGVVLSDVVLRTVAFLRPVTYTCVPVGSGQRIGLDADLDGCYDRSEVWAGTDPRDPASTPSGCG